MQKNKFDVNAKLVIRYAGEYAIELSSTFVDVEHFLLGILKENNSVASKILIEKGFTINKLITYIKFKGESEPLYKSTAMDLSSEVSKAIEIALEEASFAPISPTHLLLGIMKEPTIKTKKLCAIFAVDAKDIYSEVLKNSFGFLSYKPENIKKRPLDSKILNTFGKDLTKLAANGLLDPVIGREKEILNLICVLSRRRKNNPAIVGEAGVGKTALVEGLALKIARGEVPNSLKDKRIISLDLSSIIAGTKYRGEFEDRVRSISEECKKLRDVILFIDELHIIMGAGGAEGAIDAANILKPPLSRAEIQIIGATTLEEFRKNIEKDAALERRFQKIIVDEPSESETVNIIKGIKTHFEVFHKVKISDFAILEAVNLSSRYLCDRKLPDKAIDLIDEACAAFNLKSLNDFEMAKEIMPLDIKEVVSKYTGIDSFELTQDTKDTLTSLKNHLENNIIGQKSACNTILSSIKRSKVGLHDPNRPLGSFVFLGPTGVGKTEICKALAKGLFKNEKAIIKVDMSEFMEKSSVTKLIGAPAGYIGYGEQNSITEKVRNNPYSIILLDEIEKAHPDVLNLLLQILEDGVITDSSHRKINFKNTLIIMTSNIGAEKIIHKSLGFLDNNLDVKTNAVKELKRIFKPELINRIDEIVVFERLSLDDIKSICKLMLDKLKSRALDFGITLDFDDSLIEYLSKNGYNFEYGARPLRRLITEKIENLLTESIINDEINKNDEILLKFDEKISFEKRVLIQKN